MIKKTCSLLVLGFLISCANSKGETETKISEKPIKSIEKIENPTNKVKLS